MTAYQVLLSPTQFICFQSHAQEAHIPIIRDQAFKIVGANTSALQPGSAKASLWPSRIVRSRVYRSRARWIINSLPSSPSFHSPQCANAECIRTGKLTKWCPIPYNLKGNPTILSLALARNSWWGMDKDEGQETRSRNNRDNNPTQSPGCLSGLVESYSL